MTSTTAMLSFSVCRRSAKTPTRRPQEAGRAAKLVGQLDQEAVEPVLTDRLASAGFFREKDLHEVGGACVMRLYAGRALPAFQKRLGRNGFNLLAEAVHVNIHHGVVGFIGRTAQGIGNEDDAEAPVDAPSTVAITQTSVSPPVMMTVSISALRSCWCRSVPVHGE